MQMFWQILIVFLHTMVAWVGVELYINSFYSLPRTAYILLHYLVVFGIFVVVFGAHAKFFPSFSPFVITAIVFACILAIEFVVFRFVYSGELWFFNYLDWIFPLFLLSSAVYLAEYVVKP